jgi:hypothetical protein
MKKYYIEVIGASKELYTVKADHMLTQLDGCYVFYDEEGNMIASYPINRSIIKSVEIK